MRPEIAYANVKKKIGREGCLAFLATFVIGLLTHLPALLSDIPNHDGLASIYSDQNMITSGRWFLGTACGLSSFYSLPWLIGIFAIVYLGIASILLVKLLEVKDSFSVIIISGMLVTFPSLASNFAYVFTMDGYMLGVLLAVLSVYLTGKGRFGFAFGGIALAFSMGCYQAYLPIAMLLCLYKALLILSERDSIKAKLNKILKYLYMGLIGIGLYYVILQVLLRIEGKTLADYQGINEMASANKAGIIATLKMTFGEFISFAIKSKILFSNGFAFAAVLVLGCSFAGAFIYKAVKEKWLKSLWTYVIVLISLMLIPVFTNAILFISTEVTYHLLMKYQWVIFGILAVAFISNVINEKEDDSLDKENKFKDILSWTTAVSAFVIVFCYILTDNIAYSNLQKKYEKTYAYCVRLADRIEQTEGYYQGIPIYMIGVVGEDAFPVSDITEKVTGNIIGATGDWLLYTGENYENFFKHYLGITFNFLRPTDTVYYYEPEYVEMPSFPYPGSTKVVDGVLYVKTENSDRTGTE